MKIYYVYNGEPSAPATMVSKRLDRDAFKAKITIPDKWLAGPCHQLLNFFVKTYNAKFGSEKALVAEEMQVKVGDVVLPLDDPVSQHVQEYNDVVILHQLAAGGDTQRPPGSVLCTNFGCGKYFVPGDESSNTDGGVCRHHAKGPVFHDTYKYWSCCPERRAMDWEEFEQIPPCVVGVHSTTNKPITFKQEAITSQALTEEQKQAMSQGASTAAVYEGPRRTGPREFEGARAGTDEPQKIVDGKANCRNFGCQQTFVVAENHDSACQFHAEGPVFWDTYKYWKCCPHKKAAEFDDFVKIPGCATGPHKL